MKNKLFVSLPFIMIFFIFSDSVMSYNVETPAYVHQYLTNESQSVWKLLPIEIKQHLTTPLNQPLNPIDNNFDTGDDITSGSREEDARINWLEHFWQPDNPGNDGNYSDGFRIFPSSYVIARNLFTAKVVPLYLKGEINESYYWLGRVIHLLEDAAVPAHVHLDPHPLGDALEDYTGNQTVFQSYRGSTYRGLQYNYESLPNLNLDWSTVDATSSYKQYIELFRLFWYTAQKTQYYASNDADGDTYHV